MENNGSNNAAGWLRVCNPGVFSRLGQISRVLFDFDGTLSLFRGGWEDIMTTLMVEVISGGPEHAEIELEVRDYLGRSSGVLTIRQMEWLAAAVERHGLAGPALPAETYKAMYLERLMRRTGERLARVQRGAAQPAEVMVAGADAFTGALARRGMKLYLASGTDHTDVVYEAELLGLLHRFDGGVFGALNGDDRNAKDRVMRRILAEQDLPGEALLVVGDGSVEIREGARCGAITLGVASNEAERSGWNMRKAQRLAEAGADMIVPDYLQYERLIGILLDRQPVFLPDVE